MHDHFPTGSGDSAGDKEPTLQLDIERHIIAKLAEESTEAFLSTLNELMQGLPGLTLEEVDVLGGLSEHAMIGTLISWIQRIALAMRTKSKPAILLDLMKDDELPSGLRMSLLKVANKLVEGENYDVSNPSTYLRIVNDN